MKGPRDELMTYKCDEFYFLTDPEQHLYQHFPDEGRWQLIRNPLSLEEFARLPVVKSPFFNSHLGFVLPYEAQLFAPDGTTEVRLDTPKITNMAGKLRAHDDFVPAEVLEQRVLIRRIEKQTMISVNIPCPGHYTLDIFVASDWREDRMDNACSFCIHCSGVSSEAHIPYPQMGVWGAMAGFSRWGLRTFSHNDPYIISHGEVKLSFRLTKEIKLCHSFQRLGTRDGRLDDMDRFALMRHRAQNGVSYLLTPPKRGRFLFTLFVTGIDEPSQQMGPVYKALVECRQACENAKPMPKVGIYFTISISKFSTKRVSRKIPIPSTNNP